MTRPYLCPVARLLLASRGVPRLRELLQVQGRRAVLVPTASNPLDEPAIAEEVESELAWAGLEVERLDLDAMAAETDARLAAADVIAVSGGDPFYLLAAARRTGFADGVRAALGRGAVYVGYSAGAMVAGPSLEPLRLTSPFTPPLGLDLTGLGFTRVLVLPHHDRPGRAKQHAAAHAAFAATLRLEPLRDGDVVIEADGRVEVLRADGN